MHREHLHIVYNGEIFNFVELREELMALGFRSHQHPTQKLSLTLTKHGKKNALPVSTACGH
jgi:asparagine synthetase B (glutamine-hydrolysing)